jgi:hypothetical protein
LIWQLGFQCEDSYQKGLKKIKAEHEARSQVVASYSPNSFKFFNGGWFPVGLSMLMVLTMAIGYNRYGKQKMKAAIRKVKL